MKALPHRLPKNVRPVRYSVELSSDPGTPTFSGKVETELELSGPTDVIEMHSRELTLEGASFTAAGKTEPLTIELDPSRQIVRFRAAAPLRATRGRLRVRFAGPLAASMHGIYLATDGTARAVCTQCEATDARAIFPCFDEPEFKAEIEWSIHTADGLVALSNGPLVEQKLVAGKRQFRFAPTRKVSSYLAALAIGDFEGSAERVVEGIPLKVWATKGKAAQTEFGLDYTARLLPWYEDYFAVKYPFHKYDQVAVPGFDAGAMENIGLVLFRQNLLLMDPGTSSWRQEKLIAKVIAHEFAHMWFGNLVTMRWWDDLWLNEAFAEWMAHKAVNAMSPDYRVWEDFQDDKNRALIDDALPATHPIWTPVETPDQAIEMFDVITYQKGCAVMRMLENFLGEAPFREGLRRYMKAYAYANAAGPDLWRELGAASGQPVDALMKSWIAVAGFPMVSVSLEGNKLTVSQRRFYSSPSRAMEPNDQLWSVPMVVRYEDDEGIKVHRFIAGERESTAVLPSKGTPRWCYPNAEEIGFYRVRPDVTMLSKLLGGGLDKLSAVEQMGLLEDQWALVRSAQSTIDTFLSVLEAMTETNHASGRAPIADHNVLRTVVDRLGTVEALLEEAEATAELERFRAFVRSSFTKPLAEIGLTPRAGESQNDVQRRAVLVHAMAKLGRDPAIVDAAIRYAEEERKDPRSVDPNLVGPCLTVAAILGDAVRYQRWIETFRQRKDSGAPPQVTLRYLYTFAEFRLPELVQRTVGLVKDGTVPQEATSPILGQLLSNRHSRMQAWEYVQSTWTELRTRVGDMGLSRVVEAVAGLPYSERAAIVAFFEKNPPSGAERALARALERLDEREELRLRVTPRLLARFS